MPDSYRKEVNLLRIFMVLAVILVFSGIDLLKEEISGGSSEEATGVLSDFS